MNSLVAQLHDTDIIINEVSLLKSVSFKIEQGQIIHLKGANGSGKSTLIEAILSLNKFYKGDIKRYFNSKDYGYLPQVAHQFPKIHLRFEDICLKEYSFYPKQLHSKNWHLSSGGERKKALIAKAMSESKKLLILDEPFNHLDSYSCKQVAQEIIDLSSKGVAIIYTGHEYELENSTKLEVSKWM